MEGKHWSRKCPRLSPVKQGQGQFLNRLPEDPVELPGDGVTDAGLRFLVSLEKRPCNKLGSFERGKFSKVCWAERKVPSDLELGGRE